MVFVWIIVFSILGSIGAIVTSAIFLLLKKKIQKTLIPYLVSYAVGTLLASALLGLLTQAVSRSDPLIALYFLLGGIILFFIFEKMIIWRHCHKEDCEFHSATGPILIVGDAFHNFIDGVIIAASFLTSIHIGIAVGLSIIAHEIPQELGDFAILLDKGYSKKKAFLYNLLSSLTTIPAAIIGYFILESLNQIIPYVMAISAASFIYIALSDLTPDLHQKTAIKDLGKQLLLVLSGVGTIILILSL